MNETLGISWQLLIGIVLFIISLGLIVYGINNNANSKVLFNISRLLALISVVGVWYFGNLNSKELELNVAEAKKETAEIKLEVAQAKKEAETAKLEREKIIQDNKAIEEKIDPINVDKEQLRLENKRVVNQLLNNPNEYYQVKNILLRNKFEAKYYEDFKKLLKEYFVPDAHIEMDVFFSVITKNFLNKVLNDIGFIDYVNNTPYLGASNSKK